MQPFTSLPPKKTLCSLKKGGSFMVVRSRDSGNVGIRVLGTLERKAPPLAASTIFETQRLLWYCVEQMEIALHNPLSLSSTSSVSWFTSKVPESIDLHLHLSARIKFRGIRRKNFSAIPSSLPETAVSVAVVATAVGAAATLLVKRTKASGELEVPLKTCEDCGGSGICSECKGEGFVLKRLSEESAERARLTAKNMATRYTAGLPKKWSYCTKCSSSRACITCDGRGKLKL